MIIDDSQITESPGDEPMCYCDNPGEGTAGVNSIRCTNNEITHCASNQECFAPAGVPLSQRFSACREPLVPRKEIQHHSTECGSNDMKTHPVVCPEGYALSSWEMVACDDGQAANLIDDNARCIGHIWTDIFANSAGECAERLRDHPDCKDQKIFQWAERSNKKCGCFNGDPRHCRFESGRVGDHSPNVYEMFGFRVNYECIRVNQLEKEFKETECAKSSGSCSWQHIANAAISGFNDLHLSSVTADQCKEACCANSQCKSFDYHKNTNKCDLSFSSAAEAGGLKTDYSGNPYDHYELVRCNQDKIERNVDYLGFDIRFIDQVEDAESCGKLCAQTPLCKTWTYIKAPTHAHFKRCHLKSSDSITATTDTCCDSGLQEAWHCSDRGIDFECGVNSVLKEVRAVTSGCTGGDVRYKYVCSKIANGDEPQVNKYEALSPFTGSTVSLRCGPGDLLAGWGSGVSQCIQRKEGYEPLKGHQVACGWEASSNGEAHTSGGNSVNCGRICDSRSDCNSFTMCGETCYFTSEVYDEKVTKVCRDDRGGCTSYRNVNFVL